MLKNQKLSLLERQSIWRDGNSKSINFIVTEDCQLRCRYCYICGKNTFHKMDFQTAKKTIDYVLSIEDFSSYGSVVFEFIGGEPLLEVELIDQICDYAKLKMYELNHPWFDNYRISFSTNGLLYSSPKVQQFIKKNLLHLSIGISIDGTKEKHDCMRIYPDNSGSYNDVVKNIPLWKEQFPFRYTKATISHDDLRFVKDSILHLWSLGIHEVVMNTVYEDVWLEGDDQVLEEQLVLLADEILAKNLFINNKCTLFERQIGFPLPLEDNKNWCGAGAILSTDTKGNFHPCMRFAKYSLNNKQEVTIGSGKNGENTNRLRPFLALNRTVQSPQECIDCEVASGCAWCQGNNYDCADTETIYQRATYSCKMHKARVRANNYLWNKLDKLVPPAENDDRVRRLKLRKGLQSLFVLMDSDAPSFCYYKTREMERKVMDDEALKKVAFYALTENLSLNLILGEDGLTEAQKEILKWNDYVVYRSGKAQFPTDDKTINVFDFESDTWDDSIGPTEMFILRISKDSLTELPAWLEAHSLAADKITVFVKEMETMTEAEFGPYKAVLDRLAAWLPEREEEKPFELSLLTDRLQLEKPNHCDAGVKHVTIGPDGNFYVCPGFYYREKNKDFLIADIDTVLKTHELPIKNKQLYKLDHAPICENCDAWQCRRCVWLNKETTLEVNTPSRQQCVCAHLERNASRDLIEPLFIQDMVSIPEIEYLDPFEELMKKNQPFIEKGKVDEC